MTTVPSPVSPEDVITGPCGCRAWRRDREFVLDPCDPTRACEFQTFVLDEARARGKVIELRARLSGQPAETPLDVDDVAQDVEGDALPAAVNDAVDPQAVMPYVPDRYGLHDRLFKHQRNQGGTLAFMTGIQGCGKTTCLLCLAAIWAAMKEAVIWRGRHIDSWHLFPGDVKIWAQEPIEIWKVGDELGAPPVRWDLPVHDFDDPRDIVERADKGCLNVVYAKERGPVEVRKKGRRGEPASMEWLDDQNLRFWDRIIDELAHKISNDWHALIIDEAHEVWHDRPTEDNGDWSAQGKVRDNLADFRKTFNSLLLASHEQDEIDDRILKKLQFRIYGRGAKVASKSRVNATLPLNLAPGRAILDSLHFCEMAYPALARPPYSVKVRPAAV